MIKATIIAITLFTSSTSYAQNKDNYQIRALTGDEMFKQSAQMYLDNNKPNLKKDSDFELDDWSKIITKKLSEKLAPR